MLKGVRPFGKGGVPRRFPMKVRDSYQTCIQRQRMALRAVRFRNGVPVIDTRLDVAGRDRLGYGERAIVASARRRRCDVHKWGCMNGRSGLLIVLLAFLALAPAAAWSCDDGADGGGSARAECGQSVHAAAVDARDANAPRYLFWQVSAPGATLYLFGSIHFGRADMYPLSRAVERAFGAADALVVEANIAAADPGQTGQWMAAQAIYQDGSTLDQKLAPATWQRLTKTAADLGMPTQLLSRQRPWLVSLTLSALAMQRYGYGDELGIDNHFLQAAGGKAIIELESVQQQLGFFDGFSEQEQEAMLVQTLDDIARGPELLQKTVNAWRAGADGELDSLLNDAFRGDAASRRLYRVLIVDRNAAMTAKLTALLKRGGTYFVVVGAAHLVGEQGIVSQLRERGYRIGRP